jgi:DNA adenine methylase
MFYSPLRYPGGKTRLAKTMDSIFVKNNLLDGTYVEPYAGGAGVALHLLITGRAGNIVVNDADPVIYAFWQTLLEDYQTFIARIEDCDVSIENWYTQKNILNNHLHHSISDVGFAAFFLNRTNVSGVLKGGCIGGLNQQGNYKIDVRFNKDILIKRIKLIGLHKNRIRLFNLDAMDLLDLIQPELTQQSLVYLDPPYYVKGSTLYRNYYKHDDHVAIADRIKKIETPWVITYDNVEPIQRLYRGQNSIDFYLTYAANRTRLKGSEVMIYNNLQLPEVEKLHLVTTV